MKTFVLSLTLLVISNNAVAKAGAIGKLLKNLPTVGEGISTQISKVRRMAIREAKQYDAIEAIVSQEPVDDVFKLIHEANESSGFFYDSIISNDYFLKLIYKNPEIMAKYINMTDRGGHGFLHYATSELAVRVLVKAGIDVNKTANYTKPIIGILEDIQHQEAILAARALLEEPNVIIDISSVKYAIGKVAWPFNSQHNMYIKNDADLIEAMLEKSNFDINKVISSRQSASHQPLEKKTLLDKIYEMSEKNGADKESLIEMMKKRGAKTYTELGID